MAILRIELPLKSQLQVVYKLNTLRGRKHFETRPARGVVKGVVSANWLALVVCAKISQLAAQINTIVHSTACKCFTIACMCAALHNYCACANGIRAKTSTAMAVPAVVAPTALAELSHEYRLWCACIH